MIDFATKLPRLAELVTELTAIDAPEGAFRWGVVRAQAAEKYRLALDTAIADIPALGWDAPYSLLSMVKDLRDARRDAGPTMIGFDQKGNGPFCAHGEVPFFCHLCTRAEAAEEALLTALVRLAGSS